MAKKTPTQFAKSGVVMANYVGDDGSNGYNGTAGADTINGLGGTDFLYGFGGDDSIQGGNDTDYLYGGDGNDVLSGQAGNDEINGADGDDRLNGGAGADSMFGGAGNDVYNYVDADDTIVESTQPGIDTVRTVMSSYTLGANVESLVLLGNTAQVGVGNASINEITSFGGNDVLSGMAGNDTLYSGVGNDTLNGGDGNDLADGQAGNDTLNGDAGNDILSGGAGDDSTNGGADDDTLSGGAGRDTLDGGAGNDILIGGVSRDILTGGSGSDRFIFGTGDFGGLTVNAAERITDFSAAEGDLIDLAGAGNGAILSFVGSAAFSNSAGEVRFEVVGGNTMVYGDTDGDGVADFALRLDGVHALTGDSFVLGFAPPPSARELGVDKTEGVAPVSDVADGYADWVSATDNLIWVTEGLWAF